jgi:hypothetical protein
MLHACFTPISFCFVYTLWRFYAFPGTNLLTRCHSASSCFCVSEKLHRKFSRNWTKVKVPIYLTQRRSPKERRRRARRRPHHGVAQPTPWPHHQVVWAPWPPSDIALPPINSLHRENPKPEHLSMKHTASRRHRRPEIGRVQKLFPAPYRRGESSPEAFFITMPASGVMCELSTTGPWVHSSS